MWGVDTTMEAWRFARLFLGRKWIVEKWNSRDYMELGRIVKARRRQSMNALQPYPAAGYMFYKSCIQTHTNKRFLLTRCAATQFG